MRFLVLCLLVLLISCSTDEKQFRLIPSEESGITFKNTITETVDFNIFNYMYFFNGGGVGVGDFNGDDLLDIYLTANQLPNKLYLNQGNLKFQDVTETAGVEGFDAWTTGVAVADVNADGRLDIYVSYLGQYLIYNGRNQLFINEGNDANGVPVFKDRAREYGLDLIGFSTQAAFFDYDRDGDLDMYMLNHSLHQNGTFGRSELRKKVHPLAGDKLLRNDNKRFVEVTEAAGIYSSVIGYGLGVTISDVNLDGWLDIYVGNDFHENDYLYINQQDGTFRETAEQSMTHTSRYTMGVDLADFNNDAYPDLIGLDMLPADPVILKSSQAEESYDVNQFKLGFGYHHQFARNVLQLNNHNGTFSDIALMAGVAATDWSWSALMADFNLDGHKDIYVSNGILKRPNDLDYLSFISIDSIQMKINTEITDQELTYSEKMPRLKIANVMFVNNGDSTFSNQTEALGLAQPSYSNGTAYADLDNDGDLDLVVNNLEDEAFLYENLSRREGKQSVNNFIQFKLDGPEGNKFAIGTKVIVYVNGGLQINECIPTKGFQSSVDYRLSFGIGKSIQIDSIMVIWPDGKFERQRSLSVNSTVALHYKNAAGNFDYNSFRPGKTYLCDASQEIQIPFVHQENPFVEFTREQLIPHMMSEEGPALAVADVNRDGLEDFFIGGGKWQASALFVQQSNGGFEKSSQMQFELDSVYEDVDAIFFDADGDADKDLFVVSGGNEWSGKSPNRRPRLYLNQNGLFKLSNGVEDIFLTGSTVAVHDFDKDGDIDIFLGGRAEPWKYGVKPDSYLLVNDGAGNFKDVTQNTAPDLKKFGFVKNATWADINGDTYPELIIAAEWSAISIFQNQRGQLSLISEETLGLKSTAGWWNTVQAIDVDNDGDLDVVAGNLGLNSKLHASAKEPVTMYISDFDKNSQIDQVITHYMNGKEVLFHSRDELVKQMPFLKKDYLSYKDFAKASSTELFGENALKNADQFKVYEFRSAVFENLGEFKFTMRPLDKAVQMSTVATIFPTDFNEDGQIDLVLAGNFFPVNNQLGRYDASYGSILINVGHGKFKTLPTEQTGLDLKGEIRKLLPILIKGKKYYLAARNDDSVLVIGSK